MHDTLNCALCFFCGGLKKAAAAGRGRTAEAQGQGTMPVAVREGASRYKYGTCTRQGGGVGGRGSGLAQAATHHAGRQLVAQLQNDSGRHAGFGRGVPWLRRRERGRLGGWGVGGGAGAAFHLLRIPL